MRRGPRPWMVTPRAAQIVAKAACHDTRWGQGKSRRIAPISGCSERLDASRAHSQVAGRRGEARNSCGGRAAAAFCTNAGALAEGRSRGGRCEAGRAARSYDRAIVRRATRCDAGPAARSRDRATRHVAIRHETPPTAPCSRRSRSTRSPAPAGRCVRGCRATSSAGRRARATRSTSARHVALSPAGKARNELGAAVGELGEECRRRVRRLATVIHGMPGDLWLALARGTGVVRVRRWPYGRTAEAHGSDCARSAPRPDRCRPAQRRAACDGARRTFPISLSISIIDSS
jgi:hypothetical protein